MVRNERTSEFHHFVRVCRRMVSGLADRGRCSESMECADEAGLE